MSVSTAKAERHDPVKQFSIFTEHKVGRLNEFVRLLATQDIHVMALNTLETTDAAIMRVVVDDPEKARSLFQEHAFPFTESELLVVEIDTAADLERVLAALLAAEINIHFIYSFMIRPKARSALAMNVEDLELAAQALRHQGFSVLSQADIAR